MRMEIGQVHQHNEKRKHARQKTSSADDEFYSIRIFTSSRTPILM